VTDDASVQTLIVDEGELDDVRDVLRDLEVPFAERGRDAVTEGVLPSGLLITTPQYAVPLEKLRVRCAAESRPIHVVVTGQLTRTMRGVLDRLTCDIVVVQPVHPSALSLLILRALYRGTERRQAKRVAIGARVKAKLGRRSFSATLTQLSLRGCGLECDRSAEVGAPLSVVIPGSLTGSGSLTVGGRVVGLREPPRGSKATNQIAVFFDALDVAGKRVLREVMRNHAVGGAEIGVGAARAPTPPAPQAPPTATPTATPTPTGATASGRGARQQPRMSFPRPVLAGVPGGSTSLIGCDLSRHGMRIQPEPGLCLGDELKLAIYGGAGLPPIAIRAVVYRDDGDAGLFLRFRAIPPATEAKLLKLLESLPTLSSKEPDEGARPGVVVSKVIERS
jgi:hypothetical protein